MWQIRNKLIVTGLTVILAACSSVVPLTKANKVWLGRPLADLVAAWGPLSKVSRPKTAAASTAGR